MSSSSAFHSTPGVPARQDVEFPSDGVLCRAWLSYPSAQAGPVPLVVMAHGFGGTREDRLEAYGVRFNAAGFATLIFDYRNFGASDGQPRGDLDWKRELADWHAAIAFARTLQDVDAARIALWGTSFAGGLVVMAAARDHGIAAIVSQCPLLDGLAASLATLKYSGPFSALRLAAHGLLDVAGAAFGAPPRYVPAAARPGELGAMTSADALSGVSRINNGSVSSVTARSTLRVAGFRPLRSAGRVRCPALMQICTSDSVAPPAAAERAAARMPKAEVLRYAVGHFDIYVDEAFERSVSDQTAFLSKHLRPVPQS